MGKLFENSGSKIKVLAMVLLILGIIASIALSIIFGWPKSSVSIEGIEVAVASSGFEFLNFILILAGGLISSFVSSLLIYGFGDLVENSSIIKNKISNDK